MRLCGSPCGRKLEKKPTSYHRRFEPVMEKQKIREQLTVKKLGLEHLDQFNDLFRYVFQVTKEDLQKSGYEDGELIRSKRLLLERADIFGWFKDERLVSQVCVCPCEVNVHGRVCRMGGLTGVGAYPEYSGMGLVSELIRLALEHMRQNKQWISYLYPYSIPFYRRKGWEILSDHISYAVKDSQLPKQTETPGFVERRSIDHPDVSETYARFARQTHGALIRGPEDWEEFWRWENEEEHTAGIYYNADNTPSGYVIYAIHHDVFYIKEKIYLNQESRRGLWNFIGAHFSMIDEVRGHIYKNEPLAFYLEDSQITEKIEPYFMARIVDVAAFLEGFPFNPFSGDLSFVVSDPIAEWNNGTFSVAYGENGCNRVTREVGERRIYLDVRALTSMLMNYRRASFFAELQQVRADAETVALLERAIPSRQPYFSDYF